MGETVVEGVVEGAWLSERGRVSAVEGAWLRAQS